MSHWRQLNWDQYRLVHNGVAKDFSGYDPLFRYCRKHGIDATQV